MAARTWFQGMALHLAIRADGRLDHLARERKAKGDLFLTLGRFSRLDDDQGTQELMVGRAHLDVADDGRRFEALEGLPHRRDVGRARLEDRLVDKLEGEIRVGVDIGRLPIEPLLERFDKVCVDVAWKSPEIALGGP